MDALPQFAGPGPQNAYDDLPYTSRPFSTSHPDHLHAIARLFGLPAPPPDEASILELGCARGGNLIPLAVQMPGARVVGVDLSARQITEARALSDALGLKNCQLHAMDFQAIDDAFGRFDYIICHGVFSWVPQAAQRRIFEVCQDRLSANGVAYISYNAYPGWFMRGMVRQMMLYHTAQVQGGAAKVGRARALLQQLVEGTEGQNTPYAAILRQEMRALADEPDDYLLHDHLEDNNWPVLFHQFIDQAQAHGLQFLGESNLADMVGAHLSPQAAQVLDSLATDMVARAQYSDFLTNRMFRRTLLCRSGPVLQRQLGAGSLDGARFSAQFRLKDAASMNQLGPDVDVVFLTPADEKLPTRNPLLKALCFCLMEAWPRSLSAEELQAAVQAKLAAAGLGAAIAPDKLPSLLRGLLLHMLVRDHAEARFLPDRFVTDVSPRPMVSPLVRLQCRQSSGPLTTQRHTMFTPDVLTRLVTSLLDGTRSRQELAETVGRWVKDGLVKLAAPPGRSMDKRALQAAAIEHVLGRLRQQALLVD